MTPFSAKAPARLTVTADSTVAARPGTYDGSITITSLVTGQTVTVPVRFTFVDALPRTRLGRHVAGQLVRCGTSSPPNYEEGRAAESRADFVHKLGICHKELRETGCWLRLVIKAEMLPEARLTPLCDECDQLCKIIGRSILTARKNRRGEMNNEKREMEDGKYEVRGGRQGRSFCISHFPLFISRSSQRGRWP